MRYRLRTLLIVLGVAPPLLAGYCLLWNYVPNARSTMVSIPLGVLGICVMLLPLVALDWLIKRSRQG